jgi:hypothetical protein
MIYRLTERIVRQIYAVFHRRQQQRSSSDSKRDTKQKEIINASST